MHFQRSYIQTFCFRRSLGEKNVTKHLSVAMMLSVNKKSFNDLCGLRSWDMGGLVGGGIKGNHVVG